MKRFLSLLISFALIILNAPRVLAQNEIRITVDGKEIYSDQPPIIKNDRVFVPVRVIAESLGATVDFEENYGKQVYISDGSHTSEFTIDYAFCLIDGLELAMDTKPFIENSRTLLPVRIVSQALGCHVLWDNDTKTVNIQKTEYDEGKYDALKIYPDKPLVYEAFHEEIPYYYSPHYVYYDTYSVPGLNINQEDAKAVSKAIYDRYEEYIGDNIRNNETLFFECHYSYYLYDGILSVIMYSLFDNDWDIYDVFNYDIESGKALTKDDILSRYNIESSKLVSAVRDNSLAHFEINCAEWKIFEYYSYLSMQNSVLNNFSASSPIFIDNNGYIRAVVSTYRDDDGQFTVDTGIKVDD